FSSRRRHTRLQGDWSSDVCSSDLVVAGIAAAAVYFTRAALLALPDVADTSIPSASAWAQQRQIELPFTDFESLRAVVIDTLKERSEERRVGKECISGKARCW